VKIFLKSNITRFMQTEFCAIKKSINGSEGRRTRIENKVTQTEIGGSPAGDKKETAVAERENV